MTEKLTYIADLKIENGPQLMKTAVMNVEAYDIVTAKIEKNSGPTSLNVQPSGSGKVVALFITSDNYTSMSYTVDLAADQIQLDGPQLFLGAGQVALLGGGTCNTLIVTNGGSEDANLRILVGRAAEAGGA